MVVFLSSQGTSSPDELPLAAAALLDPAHLALSPTQARTPPSSHELGPPPDILTLFKHILL